jgi:hypothetical protein
MMASGTSTERAVSRSSRNCLKTMRTRTMSRIQSVAVMTSRIGSGVREDLNPRVEHGLNPPVTAPDTLRAAGAA